MYTISKDFAWSASHALHGLPDGHPCGRLHGHNYLARVTVTAPTLNDVGFVVDFGDLKPFGDHIGDHLDHQHLNDVLDGNPTAEHLSDTLTRAAADTLCGLRNVTLYVTVAVSETPKTWATGQMLTVDPTRKP